MKIKNWSTNRLTIGKLSYSFYKSHMSCHTIFDRKKNTKNLSTHPNVPSDSQHCAAEGASGALERNQQPFDAGPQETSSAYDYIQPSGRPGRVESKLLKPCKFGGWSVGAYQRHSKPSDGFHRADFFHSLHTDWLAGWLTGCAVNVVVKCPMLHCRLSARRRAVLHIAYPNSSFRSFRWTERLCLCSMLPLYEPLWFLRSKYSWSSETGQSRKSWKMCGCWAAAYSH